MGFSHSLGGTTYRFDDLRTLLAKATPPRSGDVLARSEEHTSELQSL